ncbi:MAG: TonB-dependent receptor, partial [Acidobacteria bacterium]|nr:TonB-dependent receptor [Acidobacteriota bacterium]
MSKLLLLATALASVSFAQAVAGFGGISGVVRDASGAVVPSAEVIVENSSKGIRRTLVSNDAGVFAAPALVPSTGYSVKVSKAGFRAFEVKEIEILVGQNVNINASLSVESATTQVDITDQAPIVEQTKTGTSQVVNSLQIRDLPINGRRVDSFVLLTPAVVSDGTFGLVSFRGIAGGNSYLTDGNDTTNQFYNENAGRTRISSQISQDAVQEFQVLTNGYSAEFGRASGGVINTVTRSGGNETHGTAYWFFRNQDFSARDRYAAINPKERRDQFGGSLGGAIVK